MKICLGGTFDIIHQGHKLLLDEAFSFGSQVQIGLTSDEFAIKGRKEVNPYEAREKKLESYLKRKKFRNYRFEKINDPYGPSTRLKDLGAIVVSEGTKSKAKRINRLRAKKGFKPLMVFIVPFVLAEDCTPISSRKIRAGEIDGKGRMLRPLLVCLGSENRNKLNAAKKIFSKMFKRLKVKPEKVRTSVPDQPFGRDTVKGAVERARKAISKGKGDYGVGIEAGLFWSLLTKNYFDVQYCAIVDKAGKITIGHGAGFAYPEHVIEEVKEGASVGEAMEDTTGIRNIGEKMGAIGYLSKGMLNRQELTEQAILMALVPRIRKELYP